MSGSMLQILMMAVLVALLFYVCIPGVLIELPQKTSSTMTMNLTHSAVFAALFSVSYKMVLDMVSKY